MTEQPTRKYMTKYGEVEMTQEQYDNYLVQTNPSSHGNFMQDRPRIAHVEATTLADGTLVGKVSEAGAKQHMRRIDAFSELGDDIALTQRQSVGTGVRVEYIDFATFAQLQRDYQQALDAKETHDSAMRRVGFQPTSIYATKLYRLLPDGTTKVIRKLLEHEVGVRPNGTIVCLTNKAPYDEHEIVVGAHTGKAGR